MPCSDGNATPEDYRIAHIQDTYERQVIHWKNKSDRFEKMKNLAEAGLCAVLTELENRGILEEIITIASDKGMINLSNFWKFHKNHDKKRLAYEVSMRYSKHEIEEIKKLINEGTI